MPVRILEPSPCAQSFPSLVHEVVIAAKGAEELLSMMSAHFYNTKIGQVFRQTYRSI